MTEHEESKVISTLGTLADDERNSPPGKEGEGLGLLLRERAMAIRLDLARLRSVPMPLADATGGPGLLHKIRFGLAVSEGEGGGLRRKTSHGCVTRRASDSLMKRQRVYSSARIPVSTVIRMRPYRDHRQVTLI